MVPSNFPTINITTRDDIDIIVNYFRINRLEFDDIVGSWIEDIISDRPILSDYYHRQMKMAMRKYRPIKNRGYMLGKENKVRKKIEKLRLLKERLEWDKELRTKKKVVKTPDYNVIKIHQPIASMIVSGLMQVINGDNMPAIDENEVVFVYAEGITRESERKLWADTTLFGSYHNALNMGTIVEGELLPQECYVGFFKIGKKTKKGYYVIKETGLFDKPVKELTKGIHSSKLAKDYLPKITFENNILRIPLNKELWSELYSLKRLLFYWIPQFDNFYSSRYALGNAEELYDIIFFHRTEERRFKQNKRSAVSKQTFESSSDGEEIYALLFDLKQLSPRKKYEESAFDALQRKDWILDWNCVKFKQGYFVVLPPVDGKIKFKPEAVAAPGVLESFNYLKDYLNDRLQPVHCSVEGMKITIYDRIRLNEAIEKFTAASRQASIKTAATVPARRISPVQMSFKQALSKAQQMTPEDFQKYKSKYIDYLVTLQSRKYKVIPCVERLAHSTGDTTEYAFMFSIECSSGKILIVHENVNPDRSTLLFVVKHDAYDKSIREIYNFLQSAEINKRSSLRSRDLDLDDAQIISYKSINHDDLYSWKQTISTYKRYR